MRKKEAQGGFSLVEMIVAIAIIGTSVLAVYGSFLFAIKINHRAKNVSIAYQAVQQEMEIVRNSSFDELALQTDGSFLGTVPGISQLPNATATLTVREYDQDGDGTGNPDIKEVIAQISYDNPTASAQKTVEMTTLVVEGGLSD